MKQPPHLADPPPVRFVGGGINAAVWRAAVLLACFLPALMGRAQAPLVPLGESQNAFLLSTNYNPPARLAAGINWQALGGVPLNPVTNAAAGSDGRAPTAAAQLGFGNGTNTLLFPTNAPTPNQFAGFVPVGGVSVAATPLTLNSNLSFTANALNLGWPVAKDGNGHVMGVLRAAQVGAPYLNNLSSLPFGGVIAPPLVTETGGALTNGLNLTYWQAAPLGWQTASNYYFSTNANAVFATQPGQPTLVWQKLAPTNAAPPPGSLPPNWGYISNSFSFYLLFTNSYLVSGIPVKTPQNMYWTEGNYAGSGHPVNVTKGSIGQLNIIYNNNFPQYVPAPGDTAQGFPLYSTNTFWYDNVLNELRADNIQGLIFMELLGEQLPGGGRSFLGFELVNVSAAPSPVTIPVELGTRINAYPNGADDSQLMPYPSSTAKAFYYTQNLPNNVVNLYATTLTVNLNDFECFWLNTGVGGLQWPLLLNRYVEYWPTNAAEYVHYARPYVTTAAAAAATAVKLPASEAPSIAYQDVFTNRSPASLDSSGNFYTYLDLGHPAHRTLIQFLSGNQVFYERVFSWLDFALTTNSLLAGSVATNLTAWVTTTNGGIVNSSLQFSNSPAAPYVITNTVNVGDRINAPAGELGSGAGAAYLAGSIVQSSGILFNPYAYIDPFASGGFAAANNGAIIPVNAIPGQNTLEVLWFRTDHVNTAQGFQPSYWPAVIGYYQIQWPTNDANQIVLASNAGSGPLNSLANATIYAQNNPSLPGYNPNEEHAMILASTAYALRDDLNNTNAGTSYSSAPFVLVQYLNSDLRPAMVAFQVRREAPEQGILFDYIVKAGSILQAPMPLPLLAPPVYGAGTAAINFNTEPPGTSGDLPAAWNSQVANSSLGYYGAFTYQDRSHNYWVYRGLNAGLPPMQIGAYNVTNQTFAPLPPATAVVGSNFVYYVPASRLFDGFTLSATPALPTGLSFTGNTTNGLLIAGTPNAASSNLYTLTVSATDGTSATATLSLNILTNGSMSSYGPLGLTATNPYTLSVVTYSNRPPFLASTPAPSNSFTMRFYYKNQAAFDWPGYASPPTNGAVVPYLLPYNPATGFAGEDPTTPATTSLDIVYRPVWPALNENGQPLPTLYAGQTLAAPMNNLPAIRGQSSVQVLYQQSIATNNIQYPTNQSVVLFDPTVNKTAYLGAKGLPASVVTMNYQGLVYFPNLPPNLVNRVWFDPNSTNLVLQGVYENQTVGDSYLFLNVLNGADLAAVQKLCSSGDPAYGAWQSAVAGLAVSLYTFGEALDAKNNLIPGTYVNQTNLTQTFTAGQLVSVSSCEQQVDSYALATTGPGLGYVSFIVANSINPKNAGDTPWVYVIRVGEYQAGTNAPGLYPGQLVTVYDPNPLSELISFQHTLDLGGNSANYQYDWRIEPPMNGLTPTSDPITWPVLTNGLDVAHYTLAGAAGVQSLSDNFVAVRYREIDAAAAPANTNWSPWTSPAFAPGYIKRVLEGINPFEQTSYDLFNNPVNTTGNILTEAGHRWEGDVALNASTLGDTGLIQIYETVLNRGKALSINAGINYGPANDALLLAAGEISDLYTYVANDAAADEANPTISIGTANSTYASVATALFNFQGQEPSLLEEELALLRGREDSVTTVTLAPVYNRLYWNYTHGIASGEVIYALNYDIQDENGDGKIDATDAAVLYPMGHGDAYGHYLTALGNYYQLLMNPYFDWVPQAETVSILGASVAVNYEHERKFAASAGSLAQTGLKVFELTWREGYMPGTSSGWNAFDKIVTNAAPRTYLLGAGTNAVTKTVARYWGLDHWATRAGQGAYLNWVVGNAILPPVDPNPNDQGIQKVDRTTVAELNQLPRTVGQLQSDMDNAEAGFTPFNLSQNAIPFDINPKLVTGTVPQTHFEQIYARALVALNNAATAFIDAEGVTVEMRQQQDSLADFQAGVVSQELAYNNQLIEIYGSPYPNDIGPGGTYPQGYNGPDTLHYTYVDTPSTNLYNGILPNPQVAQTNYIDVQSLPMDWSTTMYSDFNSIIASTAPGYKSNPSLSIPLVIGPNGFFSKPAGWTSPRKSPGSIQTAISALLAAQDALRQAAAGAEGDKQTLDTAQNTFNSLVLGDATTINNLNDTNQQLTIAINTLNGAYNIANTWFQFGITGWNDAATVLGNSIPTTVIAGLADGGDFAKPLSGVASTPAYASALGLQAANSGVYTAFQVANVLLQGFQSGNSISINDTTLDAQVKNAVQALGTQEGKLQGDVAIISQNQRKVQDAQAAYQAQVAKGQALQADRAAWRQHTAALVQGYRTRDAAFRLFQNEKLERYLTLFNLAGEYAFMAAQAYDYETGLLGTSQGKAFLNQIISAQALGVVSGGLPQYSSSSSGDPGLAGALAQMKGDWDVLKGRLGFNNPDGYGTITSLRSENYRVLAGTNGDNAWQGVLQQGLMADLNVDSDVRRNCLQIGNGDGSPVPGIVLSFSTTITDGLNLFGNELSPGDHYFSSSSFATKIFSLGVCLDGYIGMDNPAAGGGVVQAGPSLDPNALTATPYVYLIPCGQDSMRSPPLGDASAIRSWDVDDVAVPLPFNVSASDFASNPFYNSANSLSEPLFAVREHQSFRPVSSTTVFNTGIYGANGALAPSQYSNSRLIGRSVWNSKWKLVIPGKNLLNDPNQGLSRFIASVKDIHLYWITYSYSGN